MTIYVPNLNTLADLFDRLIVEIHKTAYFENKKREEHQKSHPNDKLIAQWDNLSRDGTEYRSMLKNEINKMFEEIAKSKQGYKTLREMRTFKPPDKSIGDLLSERCYEWSSKPELVWAIIDRMGK